MLPCEIYINILLYIKNYNDMYNFILSCEYKKELLNYIKYNDIRKYNDEIENVKLLAINMKNSIESILSNYEFEK